MQMRARGDSGGKGVLQFSQVGRSSSTGLPFLVLVGLDTRWTTAPLMAVISTIPVAGVMRTGGLTGDPAAPRRRAGKPRAPAQVPFNC